MVSRWFLGSFLVVFRSCLGGNLVVSRWCLDGVREVSLWSLAAFWVISRWSLAIVSCWIVAGLLLVSSWFLFLTKLARLSILNWRQRIETRHFAIGVVCWVNFCSVWSSLNQFDPVWYVESALWAVLGTFWHQSGQVQEVIHQLVASSGVNEQARTELQPVDPLVNKPKQLSALMNLNGLYRFFQFLPSMIHRFSPCLIERIENWTLTTSPLHSRPLRCCGCLLPEKPCGNSQWEVSVWISINTQAYLKQKVSKKSKYTQCTPLGALRCFKLQGHVSSFSSNVNLFPFPPPVHALLFFSKVVEQRDQTKD